MGGLPIGRYSEIFSILVESTNMEVLFGKGDISPAWSRKINNSSCYDSMIQRIEVLPDGKNQPNIERYPNRIGSAMNPSSCRWQADALENNSFGCCAKIGVHIAHLIRFSNEKRI